MTAKWIQEVSPYRYQFTKDGIMENEICPIHVGYTEDIPEINPDEVEAAQWIDWQDFLKEIDHNEGGKYSPWCIEEAHILERLKTLVNLKLIELSSPEKFI